MKKALIISLKYSPGLAKDFTLIGRNLRQHGFDARYVLAEGYRWIIGNELLNCFFFNDSSNSKGMIKETLQYEWQLKPRLQKLFETYRPNLIALYNPHPLNFAVLKLAQEIDPNCRRIYYLHEPAKPNKTALGVKGTIYYGLVELFQTAALRYATDVITPSAYAHALFKEYHPGFQGNVHIVHLLTADSSHPLPTGERPYLSFIGTVNAGRKLDLFIDLINECAPRHPDWRFQIITSTPVEAEIARLNPTVLPQTTLLLKPKISDAEIEDRLRQSFATFLSHTQVTQSGNVPVSFRSGTPIIARNLPGLAQHIQHEQTGYLISAEPTVAEVETAAIYCRENLDRLSHNARITFEELFAEKNWPRHHEWLLK